MSEFKSFGFLIKLISDNMLRIVNQSIAEFGLTFQQFQIIDYIMKQDKDVSQKEIESYLNVAHPTVVGLLKRMEMKNFIVCKFNPVDKRVKNVYLTKKAYGIMEQVSRTKQQFELEVFVGMDEQEQKALMETLNTVLDNLSLK